ncbi:hypothetical protein [Nocardioides sp. SYSU D00038]|uniref:hypothetical protein n=1 Tax=Nocardioides sp. SYSU D00038 TaxID=2812554 RepID=UPI0019677E91|nr:hypothetical protein [Nocardioides sp. SYSU D00038]
MTHHPDDSDWGARTAAWALGTAAVTTALGAWALWSRGAEARELHEVGRYDSGAMVLLVLAVALAIAAITVAARVTMAESPAEEPQVDDFP